MKTAAAFALLLLCPSLCGAFDYFRKTPAPYQQGPYYAGCRSCRGVTGHRYDYRIAFDYPWCMDPLPTTRPCHACRPDFPQESSSRRSGSGATLSRSDVAQPLVAAQPRRLRPITRASATSSATR